MVMAKASGCYCQSLRRLTAEIKKRYDLFIEPAGVTLAQFALLRHIDGLGTANVATIAALADLDRSTLSRNIKPLVNQGLIVDLKAKGQRGRKLALTDRGQDALAQAERLWTRAQDNFKKLLGPQGLAALKTLNAVLGSLADPPTD
jgi:DNA-binding MarR family transcriptional regulator